MDEYYVEGVALSLFHSGADGIEGVSYTVLLAQELFISNKDGTEVM
jgi:hypothetical protein